MTRPDIRPRYLFDFRDLGDAMLERAYLDLTDQIKTRDPAMLKRLFAGEYEDLDAETVFSKNREQRVVKMINHKSE